MTAVRFYLGKCLQLVGLLGTLYGLYVGVAFQGALTQELTHLAIGAGVFGLGTWLINAFPTS